MRQTPATYSLQNLGIRSLVQVFSAGAEVAGGNSDGIAVGDGGRGTGVNVPAGNEAGPLRAHAVRNAKTIRRNSRLFNTIADDQRGVTFQVCNDLRLSAIKNPGWMLVRAVDSWAESSAGVAAG